MASGITISGIEEHRSGCRVFRVYTLTTTFMATMGQTVTIESAHHCLLREVESPVTAAQREKTAALPDFSTVLSAHEQAWESETGEASGNVVAQLKADVRRSCRSL
jgi:kojibiose phosphorylase